MAAPSIPDATSACVRGHRRQYRARHGRGLLAAQFHRSDRPGLDALRLAAGGRLSRSTRTRPAIPERVTQRRSADDDVFGRAMPAVGLNTAIPSSPGRTGARISSSRWRRSSPARTRPAACASAERGCAEPRLRRHSTCSRWTASSRATTASRAASRANVGGQYTVARPARASPTSLFGQSYQLGRPQLLPPRRPRQYRPRIPASTPTPPTTSPAPSLADPLSFTAAARFDETTSRLQRIEAAATTTSLGPSRPRSATARYEPQPELGIASRREGLSLNGRPRGSRRTGASRARVLFDLDKYKLRLATPARRLRRLRRAAPIGARRPIEAGPFQTASTSACNYTDECTTFDVSYTQSFARPATGRRDEATSASLMRLELRTLGEITLSPESRRRRPRRRRRPA